MPCTTRPCVPEGPPALKRKVFEPMRQPCRLACVRTLIAAVWLGFAAAGPAAAKTIESYAVVHKDGTLSVRGKRIRLHGIYIPRGGPICQRNLQPAFCGSRAAVALDFKIQRFVRCEEVFDNDDGTISAVCWTNYSHFDEGEDLGAYLIAEGLALAGPDAPFEYRALERIAQANGVGLWGFQVNSIETRRRR